MPKKLILVLGDQLTPNLSSLAASDPARDVVLMVEVVEEATYVRHHKKKIALIFSAMRHFAEELRAAGWSVDYRTITDTGKTGSFTSEVARAIKTHKPGAVVVTEPGEYRVAEMFERWKTMLTVPVEILRDTRFVCAIPEFAGWARDR